MARTARELEKQLVGLPVTFTGFLQGAELSQAIASADVKLFPSTTDTWGNAPLEAQASGLPVIVSDVGGPTELMVDGMTGFKVKGRDAQELYDAMVMLMDEPTRLRMGQLARTFAEANRVDEPFTAILDSETHRRRLQEQENSVPNDPLQLRHTATWNRWIRIEEGLCSSMTINPFRKIFARLLLSRAKHRRFTAIRRWLCGSRAGFRRISYSESRILFE